MKNTKQNK